MNESFLYYIWQFQYFDKHELRCVAGEKIEVFEPGILNNHAGPDFLQAKIRIGDLSWAGSVEIHTKSSDWLAHQHHTDGAYENVILHVVWINDRNITRADHTVIPTLELGTRIQESLISDYKRLVHNPFVVPCAKSLPRVDRLILHSMLDRALSQRLEIKTDGLLELLAKNNHDWEETTWQLLAKNFGMKVNGEAFFQLATSLPYKLILRHADKPYQVEALLFGQAGFLDVPVGDEYYNLLQREYNLLSAKYSLREKKLVRAQWKFLRLRPANFPTVRLAQLSAVMQKHPAIFSRMINEADSKELLKLPCADVSLYWREHYRFNKRSKGPVATLGSPGVENILINTVIPILVTCAKLNDDQRFMDRALALLQDLPAEDNTIIRTWKSLGYVARNGFDSQALIELYNNYCQRRNCLTCVIGASLLKPRIPDVTP